MCAYGDVCIYRTFPRKYSMSKCDECDARVHALCSHEAGHSMYRKLCPLHARAHLRERVLDYRRYVCMRSAVSDSVDESARVSKI